MSLTEVNIELDVFMIKIKIPDPEWSINSVGFFVS